MKTITSGILTVMLLLIALAVVINGVPVVFDSGSAHAELSKSKMVALSGVNYSDALGNTIGPFAATKVGTAEFPDETNCFLSVTNASGVIVANTATAVIQTSINDVDYDLVQTVSVAASTVTGVYNVPTLIAPFGNYWRVKITAIQNANDSYVRARCLLE